MELLVRCSQDVGTIDADVYNSAAKAGEIEEEWEKSNLVWYDEI